MRDWGEYKQTMWRQLIYQVCLRSHAKICKKKSVKGAKKEFTFGSFRGELHVAYPFTTRSSLVFTKSATKSVTMAMAIVITIDFPLTVYLILDQEFRLGELQKSSSMITCLDL